MIASNKVADGRGPPGQRNRNSCSSVAVVMAVVLAVGRIAPSPPPPLLLLLLVPLLTVVVVAVGDSDPPHMTSNCH